MARSRNVCPRLCRSIGGLDGTLPSGLHSSLDMGVQTMSKYTMTIEEYLSLHPNMPEWMKGVLLGRHAVTTIHTPTKEHPVVKAIRKGE